MAIFSIGDPVVIVTDQMLRGFVRYVDFAHVWPLEFTPQNFRGQKGWIDNYYNYPTFYGVAFPLQGNPRTVSVRRFVGGDCEWPVATEERVESGTGRLILKADEFVHDTEPEGDYRDLHHDDDEIPPYEYLDYATRVLRNAYWLLKAREATLAPELYVAGLQEHCPQTSVEEIRESLEEVTAEWRCFQEYDFPSIQEYIRDYIAPTPFDWAEVLSAVEQAERGDSTAFTTLIRRVRVDPSILFQPPTIAVSEPLKVRWK